MSPLFLIYILSVLSCFVYIILEIRFQHRDGTKITPFHIAIFCGALVISFLPVVNTIVTLLCTHAVLTELYDQGYFDKFKAWWHTPIFKDKG